MSRVYRYFGFMLLTAALATPIANARPVVAAQDHDNHDRDHDNRRVYDPYHKDYHTWDNREDVAYRHWLEGRHQTYVEYNHLKADQQRDYWNWRHEHQDHH